MKSLNILTFLALTTAVVTAQEIGVPVPDDTTQEVLDFTEITNQDKNDPDVQWDFVNSTTIDLHNDNYYTPQNPKGDGCKDVGYKDSNSYIRVLVDAPWFRQAILEPNKEDVYVMFSVNCDGNRSNTFEYNLYPRKIKNETQYIRFGMRVGKCRLSKHKIINAIKIQTNFDKNHKRWYGPLPLSPSVNCTIMNSFKTIYIPNFEI